jgi:hypothetical protein
VLRQPGPSRCSHHGQLPGRCHGKLGQRRGAGEPCRASFSRCTKCSYDGHRRPWHPWPPLTVPRGSLVIGTGDKFRADIGGGPSKRVTSPAEGRQAEAEWRCTGKDRNWQVLAAIVLQWIGNGKREGCCNSYLSNG